MGTKTSILVVDDDKKIYDQVCSILDKEKYMLAYAGNVEEAKEKMGYYNFNILLLDLILPGSSGLEIIEHIKMVVKNKPEIILMTAYEAPEMEEMAISMGAIACIFKPLDKTKVETALKRYFEKGK